MAERTDRKWASLHFLSICPTPRRSGGGAQQLTKHLCRRSLNYYRKQVLGVEGPLNYYRKQSLGVPGPLNYRWSHFAACRTHLSFCSVTLDGSTLGFSHSICGQCMK